MSPNNNNFEDCFGHCVKIGFGVSRVSSSTELKKACNEKCKCLRCLMLTLRSDHGVGKDEDSGSVLLKIQDLKEACNVFGKRNVSANGKSGRL